jgi:hypothetical protein
MNRFLRVSLLVILCSSTVLGAEKELDRTDHFPSAPGKVLILDAANLGIEIRAADVRDIQLHTQLRISGVSEERAQGWVTQQTPQIADTLSQLQVTCQPARSGFLGLGHLTARARLAFITPPDVIPDITTTSGSIELRGDFPVANPLRLRTATGDMELVGATASLDIRTASGDGRIDVVRPLDRLFARTSSGSINLSGGARDAHVDTASGNVWLANLSGSATVETSTGKVTLRWDRLDPNHVVKVRSASGKITLVVPDTVTPQGTLTTTGGTIRSDLPGTVNEAGDTVTLQGNGPVLHVETASGEILLTTRSGDSTRNGSPRAQPAGG